MVRNPIRSAPEPSATDVCSALDDPDCREIIRTLEEPGPRPSSRPAMTSPSRRCTASSRR